MRYCYKILNVYKKIQPHSTENPKSTPSPTLFSVYAPDHRRIRQCPNGASAHKYTYKHTQNYTYAYIHWDKYKYIYTYTQAYNTIGLYIGSSVVSSVPRKRKVAGPNPIL